MRSVAALYDVHGNLPALEAVLAEIERERFEAIVLGGDLAGGPMPVETLDRLLALGERARFVRGNGERELIAAFDSPVEGPEAIEDPVARNTAWCAARLTRRHRDAMAAFEEQMTIEVDGLGEVLFCHATPRRDEEIVTSLTPDDALADALDGVSADVVVCGHVHSQLDRRCGRVRMVNAGSVGMPYEGRPGAFWLALGPGVEPRRTELDVDALVAAVEATGYPDAEELLTESYVEPIDAASAAAFFERAAGRG